MALALKDPSLLRQDAYINGEWLPSDSGQHIKVIDPGTGELLAQVPRMGSSEARNAVEAAQSAGADWAARTARERGLILRKWSDLMLANQNDLGLLLMSEQGKPLEEARGEIAYAASFLEWFAEEGRRLYGDTIPAYARDRRVMVLKQPVGVCAAITPWNFPSAMITRKAGPALAAGCTMVVKPASQTPLSALALAELAHRAGVPPGVFSVITGDAGAIGDELCANPMVRKLSFTGSTEIGRKLMKQCADTIKNISLELGGNNPFIVFDDADLDAAVEGCIASKFRNTGQTCVCANRVLVQDGVYDAFAKKLAEKVARLKVGYGAEPGVKQGPLINGAAVEKVEEHIADALAHGARLLCGGSRHALGRTWFQPTVLAGCDTNMKIAHEETFGPVAALFRFGTEAEGIELANATEFGLVSYFYARDVGRVWRVSEGLEAGMVGINTGLISDASVPFGGVKQSGLGREGSKYGIDEYVEIKYLSLGALAAPVPEHPAGHTAGGRD